MMPLQQLVLDTELAVEHNQHRAFGIVTVGLDGIIQIAVTAMRLFAAYLPFFVGPLVGVLLVAFAAGNVVGEQAGQRCCIG